MKRLRILSVVLIMAVILSGCADVSEIQSRESVTSAGKDVTDTGNKTEKIRTENKYDSSLEGRHVRINLVESGEDVFTPFDNRFPDYRYSPSLLMNDDGGIDAWFASPGDGVDEYDWITYKHSDDGGHTWSDEKVVLTPSPCTPDLLSVCDPDVFYYDGYYYMGYTATIDGTGDGLCNSVFMARSANPEGPYEKWNGSGWGGLPVPVIYFDGLALGWGCGEPSFVLVNNTLYIYSTKDSYSPDALRVRVTEIRTADIRDPLWPKKLDFKGYAVIRNDLMEDNSYIYDDSDSWDVVYLEESHKFVAMSTNRRFKDDSSLLYYESDDGISFERVSEINTNVITGCHNSVIMGDKYGHLRNDMPVIIGYSYSGTDNKSWGVWSTRLAHAMLEYTDETDRSEDGKSNLKIPIDFSKAKEQKAPLMLRTDSPVYCTLQRNDPFVIRYYLRDVHRNERDISRSEINIEKYDRDILTIDEDNNIIPKAEGMSLVTIEYEGLRRDICLCVFSDTGNPDVIRSFVPVTDRYVLKIAEPYIIKIRPMAVFGNYDVHELTNEEIIRYGVTFSSSDTDLCSVGADGTILALKEGETQVTVKSGNGLEYTVDIIIKDI